LITIATLASALPAAAGSGFGVSLLQGGYNQPLYMTHAGDSRLFVVEKGGLVKIVGGGTFLDVSTQINTVGERGLLGLAFDPNYATNGLFFITYNRSDGDVILAERKVSTGDADVANPSYERVVLRIEHSSATNHNGGWIGFNSDGFLYMSTGDGGGGVGKRAQSKKNLLGKILRINPHDPGGDREYSIPASNPFVGKAGWDAIWSYGFRNPWRCSNDRLTHLTWCGDVGQNAWEEIDRGPMKGKFFGWELLEGTHYYNYPNRTRGESCTSNCKTLPIIEYAHEAGSDDNNAVVGGYVSRRPGATLEGKYVYGDLGSGRIWTVPADFMPGDPAPVEVLNTDMSIFSFAEGLDGRLYVIDGGAGEVWLLTSS
jgi:glucose/arabinose dehydrogenase